MGGWKANPRSTGAWGMASLDRFWPTFWSEFFLTMRSGLDEKKIMGEAALSKILGTHKLPN